MEFWSILEGNTLEQQILAVGQTYQVVTHLFLLLRGVCDVGIARLHLPWIPQLTLVSFYTAHLLVLVPLYVAHLAALYGTPLLAITIDDAFASDGNVVLLVSTDTSHDAAGAFLGLRIQTLVGRKIDDGVFVEMQLNVVVECDRAS